MTIDFYSVGFAAKFLLFLLPLMTVVLYARGEYGLTEDFRMHSKSPIHYVSEPEQTEDGVDPPGWYFWDEVWTTRYGPYETREAAEAALQKYILDML